MGVDDFPFSREQSRSRIVGVVMNSELHIENLESEIISVDGNDSGDAIVSLVRNGKGRYCNVIFTDGVTFAGFNIIDPSFISEKLQIPVISVTRRRPDIKSMIEAIRKHNLGENKVRILEHLRPVELQLKNGGRMYVNVAGLSEKETLQVMDRFTFRGNVPEPLRVAHMIATFSAFGRT